MNKINRPDVVGMHRAEPDDRAVLVIEPPALPVAVGQLQAFFAPQSFDFLVIDLPALHPQQGCDLSVAIPTILFGQPDHRQAQHIIIRGLGLIPQAGSRQAQHSAGSALRCVQLLTGVDHGLTQPINRQALGFK